MERIDIVECPRDAWGSFRQSIPSEAKVAYLQQLVEAGFREIDAVSFVPAQHVPQMADSEQVLERLAALPAAGVNPHAAKILGVVVDKPGFERALAAPGVATVCYPYSISANYRRQSANLSMHESRAFVAMLKLGAQAAGRDLAVQVTMAFGNPFEEPWGPELVIDTLLWLTGLGVKKVTLVDSAGAATPEEAANLYQAVKGAAEGGDLGVHLHCVPGSAAEMVQAAFEAGCRRFEGSLLGLGICPLAGDPLVSNIPTETIVDALAPRGADTGITPGALALAIEATEKLRRRYGAILDPPSGMVQ
jgi:hydroxymethylglutaryl-CoA lyase